MIAIEPQTVVATRFSKAHSLSMPAGAQTMKKWFTLILCTFMATMAFAQDESSWIVRGRLISVSPNDDSSTILTTGTGVTVDSDVVPELDFTYMFNKSWGLELILATSNHQIDTEKGDLAGADAGDVWVLPPTLTLQYHFVNTEKLGVYAGVGLNYSLFYSYDLSEDLAGLGITDIDFDNSLGASAQVGVDINMKGNWFFNLDLKYIQIDTEASLMVNDTTFDTLDVDIDPFVFGIGVTRRF